MKIPTITPQEYQALLRNDFAGFIETCFNELNPAASYLHNWHIELIASRLEACRTGKIRRLIINVPPRSLKSICSSVALPAWVLGHDPSRQIICASYGQELANKLARDCRTVMTSPWYRSLFNTRLSGQKQSVHDFMTTAQGFRMATSVGGVLTGRGADLIIIDDPLKPEDALSETERRKANDWFSHTLYSRMNDKQTGTIIVIMQRLHMDDLVGHILQQEKWELVCLPAIAELDELWAWDTRRGQQRYTRRAGEVLHPERESRENLLQIRATLNEYNYAGQYQQCPVPLGGGMIKEAWFKSYDSDQLPTAFSEIVQSWDTANKATELCDYSVCTTWGLKDQKLYLLDVFRKRMNYPELKRAVWELAERHTPSTILIEDKASGTQLVQELIADGVHAVKAVKPERGDKLMRMNAQTATIENGFVYLPQKAHWLAEYLIELTTFPKARFDDQVDSTSQALAWIKVGYCRPGMGFYELFRQRYEKSNKE